MDSDLNIFLLIGQSNMAGRGQLDKVPTLRNPRVSMFRDGRWTVAEEPLHADNPDTAGVGLGMSFAMDLLAPSSRTSIGLVPCAVGGTPLSRWVCGADLYENAVSVTRRALPRGALTGILWHQGESDSGNREDASSYAERFRDMIHSLRSQLSAKEVPVIAGELGTFLRNYDGCEFFGLVNQQLRELERTLPVYGCVSAADLKDDGDCVHFDSESLREFGIRYARKYVELTTANRRSGQHLRSDA